MGFFDHIKTAHDFISTHFHKVKGLIAPTHIEGIDKLIKASGIHIDNAKEIIDEGGGFESLIRKIVGTEKFQTGLGTAIEGLAVGLSGGEVGPILGTIAIEGAKMFATHEPTLSFKVGQWVLIDNGEEKIPRNTVGDLIWMETQSWGAMPDKIDIDLATEHIVSVGFVVSHAESNNVNVFNLETGDVRQVYSNDLRHVEAGRRSGLENNDSLKMIKGMVLNRDEVLTRLNCDVPCDPDEEVIYDDKVFYVNFCDGDSAVIHNSEKELVVKMSELKRGRTTHSLSNNYTNRTPTGFDREIRPKFFKGQFVWLTARVHPKYLSAKQELGVVRLLNAENIDGYYCVDGERFSEPSNLVIPTSEEHNSIFNRHFELKKFQQRAVVGDASVRAFSVGRSIPRLVLGLDNLTPGMTHGGVETGVIEGETAGLLMMAAKPKQTTAGVNQFLGTESMMGTGGNLAPGEPTPDGGQETENKNFALFAFAGVVCVAYFVMS